MAMNEFPDNVWAPWRMEYIHSLADDSRSGCFLCDYRDAEEAAAENHVVWRTDDAMAVMNRFPYTNGHLLISPIAHKADLEDLSGAEMKSIWWMTRDAKLLLTEAVGAHGFNIGINFGLCAGAGLPGHLHIHIVPRWNGDTNFMAVIGDVRVIPQALDRQYEQLCDLSAKLGLPRSQDESSP